MGDNARPVASLIGRQLGQYAVKSLIGRGATGTVYLAEDQALHRPVALKVLLGSLARSQAQAEALQQEAQAAAPLRHPNLVRIYAAGVEQGIPYIAMEYVRGEPLDLFLRRQGRLAWQQSLHLGRQIADALAEAHRHGIVHCDVKPANILLDVAGRARLTDFGIATVRNQEGTPQAPTRVIGTLPYMAPEQCRGDGDLLPATDLYGLGASLYQMIAGQPPFVRQSAEAVLNCIYYETPLRLNQLNPEIPDDVARLVAHLLEKNPEDRPESARETSRRVAQLLQQNGGRSAFPEAIDAFLRDQLEPRGNHYLAPSAGTVTPRPDLGARTTGTDLEDPRGLGEWTKAAVAALALLALCGTGYWYLLRPRTMQHLAPPAPALQFRELSPEMKTAQWPLPHLQAIAIRWLPDSSAVLAAFRGMPGTLASGSGALVRIRPEAERAVVLAAAAGPALNEAYWNGTRPLVEQFAVSPGLPEAVLLPAFRPGPTPAVALQVQRVDATFGFMPEAAQVAADEAAPALLTPWTRGHGGASTLTPDGETILTVLEESGEHYIAAMSRMAPGGPRRISPAGAPIVAGSLVCGPRGDRMFFVRRRNAADLQLCTVALPDGGPESMLFAGDLDPVLALSPDGRQVAIGVREGGFTTVNLVSVESSGPPQVLGSGHVSPGGWHPSSRWLAIIEQNRRGSTIVVHAAGDGSLKQAELPVPLTTITDVAIAPDGRQIAVSGSTDAGPAVVFFSLSEGALLPGRVPA
ncbi:MAG: protein kinase [Candidatus Hydrogenedentes bacterium]|nr:protein kinase [Candidatus Hydrogenedentota bacterium]